MISGHMIHREAGVSLRSGSVPNIYGLALVLAVAVASCFWQSSDSGARGPVSIVPTAMPSALGAAEDRAQQAAAPVRLGPRAILGEQPGAVVPAAARVDEQSASAGHSRS